MPLQIIPQQNQPVGLQLLGDQLMGGATDYANKRRQDDLLARQRADQLTDEQRRRGYQLSDVASNRTYEEGQQDKLRGLQLGDEQRRRGENWSDAQRKAHYENRLRSLAEAERRGLFDGQQIGNKMAEEAALAALQTQLAKEASFAQEQPINAQARLSELGQAEQAISQKMAAVEARLSAQPTVDQSAVANTALQLATQANGGKQPSREQIQAALPEAMAKAQQEAQIRWYTDKSDAQVQYQILSSQLNTIRQQQANITSTFKVAPKASPLVATPPPMASAAPAAGGDPMAGFTAALNAKMPPPATATSNAGPTVQNITSALSMAPAAAAPVLRQARTAALADAYGALDAPLATTESKLADVQQKLSRLQSGLDPMQSVTPSPLAVDPRVTGEFMTKLLLEQSALQQQLQQQRTARQTSKAGLLSGIPPNAPAPFVPSTQSSMGSLLSD